MTHRYLSVLLVLTLLFSGYGCTQQTEGTLVVYSSRKSHLVQPVFEAFTKDTGIQVQSLTDKAGALIQRLKAEGKNTPADILITVDAGNLVKAEQEGILQPIRSAKLTENIPHYLRDPNFNWVGLSLRARTLVYHTDRVKPSELSTYEDLASEAWQSRLVLRTSKKVYNQSLVAMFLEAWGDTKTKAVLSGWVRNLGTPVVSSDTEVLKAILAGKGDVGIVNTYYFGRLQKKDPSLPLKLFWPNQNDIGVHVNVSGAGVTRYAKNKKLAIQFLEWASSPKAQAIFAGVNMEYPVNEDSDWDDAVVGWGTFTPMKIPMQVAGKRQVHAIEVMEGVGYN